MQLLNANLCGYWNCSFSDPWSSCSFGAKQHDVCTMAIGTLEKIEQHHYAHHIPPGNEYNKWKDWRLHPLS
jgi:hypothetical protein